MEKLTTEANRTRDTYYPLLPHNPVLSFHIFARIDKRRSVSRGITANNRATKLDDTVARIVLVFGGGQGKTRVVVRAQTNYRTTRMPL